MTEFIPDLWLYKTKQASKLNTKHVLYIACDKDLNYLSFDDTNLTNELLSFYRYISYKLIEIDSALSKCKMVIISCKTGKYIGPLIIACYLIKYGKMTIGDTLNSMKTKKNDVFEGQIYYSQILERIAK